MTFEANMKINNTKIKELLEVKRLFKNNYVL